MDDTQSPSEVAPDHRQPSQKPLASISGFPADLFAVQGEGGKLLRSAVRLVDGAGAEERKEAETLKRFRRLHAPREILIYLCRAGQEEEDARAINEAIRARQEKEPTLPPLALRFKDREPTTRTEYFGTGYIVEVVAVVADDLAIIRTRRSKEGQAETAETAE